MRRLARLIRCAIVASATRNAFAISAVVSPPTARSVSGIADAGVSAGWQHMNSTAASRPRSDELGAGGCSRRPQLSLHARPVAAPLVDQPPRRRSGPASRGACPARRRAASATAAASSASWTASSAAPKSPYRRASAPRTCGASSRSRLSTTASTFSARATRRLEVRLHLGRVRRARLSITRRTWIGCWVATPPGPGTAESRAAISSARSSDSTSTIW